MKLFLKSLLITIIFSLFQIPAYAGIFNNGNEEKEKLILPEKKKLEILDRIYFPTDEYHNTEYTIICIHNNVFISLMYTRGHGILTPFMSERNNTMVPMTCSEYKNFIE